MFLGGLVCKLAKFGGWKGMNRKENRNEEWGALVEVV